LANVNYNDQINGNGRANYQWLNSNSLLTEETLNYTKTMGSNTLDAVAGISYQQFESYNHSQVAWGQMTQDPYNGSRPIQYANDVFVKDINAFQYKADASIPVYTKYQLASYFARVNYSINDKYFFTGTVRTDGSSKFGVNNKYGTFPAAAVKWKLLKEDFASSNLDSWFSDFSLRANYGIMGSQDNLTAYGAQQYYLNYTPINLPPAPATSGPTSTLYTTLVNSENRKLKWEQATTAGVGLDWAIKSNRVSGTIDYFHTSRSNMIFYGPLPGGFAASAYGYLNLPGNVINSGVEFSLKAEVINKSKFNWNIAYNMTFYHNTLKNFNQPQLQTGAVSGQGLTGAYAQVIQNGYSLFTFKAPVFTGFDANGLAQYADGGKDQLLKSALPNFQAGLTNTFSYGNWSLSAFLNTSRGFYVYNNTANAYFLMGSLRTAHNVTYATVHTNENGFNPGSVSTRFIEKGDFVRLSNVTLSHNIKVNGKFIKSLSVNVTGQNLYLWTKYSGLDPEVNVDKTLNTFPSRGFDYAGFPKARTFTVGVNLGF